jgi:topoisomerase IA-like protein
VKYNLKKKKIDVKDKLYGTYHLMGGINQSYRKTAMKQSCIIADATSCISREILKRCRKSIELRSIKEDIYIRSGSSQLQIGNNT